MQGQSRTHTHEPSFLGTATVGERGQVAIPASARRTYGIDPGDKLLFFSIPNRFGLYMVKAEDLGLLVEHLTSKAQSIEHILNQVSASDTA